ncbi:MAG: prepilin-type N-terminal cleavage/methylation domain-containing protein [Candidatus Gracilibacteria bacterium]|nr:prepilin-type N-terminal cleavage/methylation domain-containing protein [Candidatus Gracilibacteria bacterium]
MMKQTKKAFTLVELIIVITILAILATIGFMSYQSYTADARNSKRTNDLSSLQSKLEISVAKSVDILSLVTNNPLLQVATGATSTVGSGTMLSGTTNYEAGDVSYSVFGVNAADFKDPGTGTPSYKLGAVKSTNMGALYQFAATMEATSDQAKQSLVKGLFLTGGTDTIRGLIKSGSGTITASGLTNANTAEFAY